MGILSKQGIENKTVILISKVKIIYANKLSNYEDPTGEKPTMIFSFNGDYDETKIFDDLKDIEKINNKWETKLIEDNNDINDNDKIKYTTGYTFYQKETLSTFIDVLNVNEEYKEIFSPLIFEETNQGENAITAVPNSNFNDWTAIEISFENPIELEDIILPISSGKSDGKYNYDQLIVIDRSFFPFLPTFVDQLPIGKLKKDNIDPVVTGIVKRKSFYYSTNDKNVISFGNSTFINPYIIKLGSCSNVNTNIYLKDFFL